MVRLLAAGRVLSLLMLLALLAAAPAVADDEVVVNFESGPALETPITSEYQASSFVFFQRSDGQRPYRRSAPGRARSGSVVANIGGDLCQPEGGTGNDCEFPTGGTSGRMTRTASSVRLYAGLFSVANDTVTVQLQALRANGSIAATGAAVPISAAGFATEVAVTSGAADIARFRVIVAGPGATGAAVGFDDLTLRYPVGSLPEVSLGVAFDTAVVPQGGSVDVPVSITRLNGSSGPLALSATGLPAGVSAQFSPASVPGAATAATLRLTAAADAPPAALGVPTDISIVGDPRADGAVAPGPRAVTKAVRVASPYVLRAVAPGPVAVPTCASVEVPLRLERDSAFGGTVRLQALNLPAGVTASFAPGPDIPPGGGFFVDVKLRLTGSVAALPDTAIVVEASSAGTPSRQLTLDLRRAPASAFLSSPADHRLAAPQGLLPGSAGRIEGTGFCPGTVLHLGNSAGEVVPVIEGDGRVLRFVTPRLATSGAITVSSPGSAAYAASSATVQTFRSRNGLSFANYPVTGLSLTEAEAAFGENDFFYHVDLCYPFGCNVQVVNPFALLTYAVIDQAMQRTGGHCFGISRSVQNWIAAPSTLNRFTSGGTVYSIPGRSTELDGFLDGQHSLQASAQFITAYFNRPKTLNANLAVIRAQLAAGYPPLISMAYDSGGHAVVAYDLVDHQDGSVDILVYDNNQPFTAAELTSGDSHRTREAQRSVIRVDPNHTRWTFDSGGPLRAGGGSELFAVSRGVIPADPSLPGLTQVRQALTYLIFGSDDAAALSEGAPAGADVLPVLDDEAIDGAGGVVGRTDGKPITHTMRGVRAGKYTQAVVGDGFVGAISATTAAGVRDTTSGVSGGDGVRFQALGKTPARPLTLDVATEGPAASRRAIVATRTSGGGADVIRLAGGRALTYAHDGAPTTARITLEAVEPHGGPASFTSGPIAVGRGETLTVKPSSWATLRTVRVTTRGPGGRSRTRVLPNRSPAPAALSLSALRVRGRSADVTTRFAKLSGTAAAGLVLRAIRGGRVVAHESFKVAVAEPGRRTFRWALPKAVRGAGLRLVADASLAVVGTRTGTVRRTRSVAFRVG